jgi:superfamily II DNA/RNA helicase
MQVQEALKDMKITTMTPIQAKSIPPLLAGLVYFSFAI